MRKGGPFAAGDRPVRAWFWEAVSGSTPRGRLGAALSIAAVLAALGPDRVERGPRICVMSAIIRRPCPGCGMTRAAAALLRGDLRRAARTNWRIIPVAAVGLSVLLSDVRSVLATHRGAN